MGKKLIFFAILLLVSSCDKYYVTVRQLPLNSNSLASAHVGTPDPRQLDPPRGQELIIDWVIPSDLLVKQPHVELYLLFRNHTEKKITYPALYKSGYIVYRLEGEEFDQTGGLLTYRADIVTKEGVICRRWKHQLWVNLIDLKDH